MKTEKEFDAVKTMREIRDKLSKTFNHMTYEEKKNYLRQQLKSKQFDKREPSKDTIDL